MSKKTKKNYGFKGDTPKLRVEQQLETLADGSKQIVNSRVDHVHNDYRYHCRKGWKRISKQNGFYLLNTLLMPYGVVLNKVM